MSYITTLVRDTRTSRDIRLGASPRAAIALLLGAKVTAALEGRDYVLPDDVKCLALPTLRHRVVLKPEVELEGMSADMVIEGILAVTRSAPLDANPHLAPARPAAADGADLGARLCHAERPAARRRSISCYWRSCRLSTCGSLGSGSTCALHDITISVFRWVNRTSSR